jgi:hypothetical protein
MLNSTMVSADGDVDAAEQTNAQALVGGAACALAHHAAPVHCASTGANSFHSPLSCRRCSPLRFDRILTLTTEP